MQAIVERRDYTRSEGTRHIKKEFQFRCQLLKDGQKANLVGLSLLPKDGILQVSRYCGFVPD